MTVDVARRRAAAPARGPDLSVDGTIEIERLDNVLYVAGTAVGQDRAR